MLDAASSLLIVVEEVTRARLVPLSPHEEAFLRALARVLMTVPRAFDADLLREQGMSLSEYFTLMHLSEAPEGWMRMSDLAGKADLSISGMSRIVQRLEAEGSVRRERSTCDGRGWNAVLTEAGLSRLREVWPTHLASVRRHVMNHLQDIDLDSITRAMQNFAVGECANRPVAEVSPNHEVDTSRHSR